MDRQKVVLILVVAWISAALLTWILYSSTRAPHAESTVALEAASRDLPAGTLLREADIKTIRVVEKDAPPAAIRDKAAVLDHPLLFPVGANEPFMTGKVASAKGIEGLAATIDPGLRAISVPITDSSGVSGLIQPRSRVDVLFTRPGPLSEALTTTILEDVPVLAIGRTTEVANASTAANTAAQTATRTAAQAATLLVAPDQAEKLELAKNLGRISLVLRNPLDHENAASDTATVSRDLYSGLAPKEPPVRVVERPAPEIKPARAVAPPEPPKPKKTVEVFRGNEHSQRSFQ